ncbi:type I glutamate--ammonia ligase [Lutispora thermophila]|uniref:glutamine synthetase n=1 Tax=Lutispora thermophila DSM 19022 TaxID=1122184 RepID=A0A1M6F9B8_9FIRM|nr:glutamine synthetase [Lutispora thermophila]SHI94275.1 glutamine synthetase [Lutispora thermophila DSM 19022]
MNCLSKVLEKDLLFVIKPYEINKNNLIELIENHPEIKFISLMGIDLSGNDTDVKIPIKNFINNCDEFLSGGIQTDGSSVVLPGIATLNDGKVDIVADLNSNWYVDYNFEHIDINIDKPVGTLRIPSFLYHNGRPVDARSILNKAINSFSTTLLQLIKNNSSLLDDTNVTPELIDEIVLTSATELEFWVKTPNDDADAEALSASQVLQEQYWKRTKGSVRTAMEQALLLMDRYELSPEMGHKEVGGVKAKLDESGNLTHIMEQLEIDWKYSTALQAADNDLLVRTIIKEVFRKNGLEVTFQAKPIEGVAGSGKHTHIGVAAKLKNGSVVNLFSPGNMNSSFMNKIGYGALMGLLHNYEIVNPFVSSTIDSLNRLKPGFEAPVCIVASLGHNVNVPSRNRTVLIGLIRDMGNPLATRFEVRSPNPMTNSYLALAAFYQSMLDGIKAIASTSYSINQLHDNIIKPKGEDKFYLNKDREYISEKNIYEEYTDKERESLFGVHPSTVYENLMSFNKYHEKTKVLLENDVMTESIINSFVSATFTRWITELLNRYIPETIDLVRSCKQIHNVSEATDMDICHWNRINSLRHYLVKDTMNEKSLISRIKEAAINKNMKELSNLQIQLNDKVKELKEEYNAYKKNLIDIE